MGTFFGVVIVLILVLIFFAFLSWLAYLILYLPTEWLVKPNRRKIVRLIISPVTVILVLIIYSATHGPSNDDTATIEAIGDNYQLTLKGERSIMVHDPISVLFDNTRPDSIIITIPRPEGIISGQGFNETVTRH